MKDGGRIPASRRWRRTPALSGKPGRDPHRISVWLAALTSPRVACSNAIEKRAAFCRRPLLSPKFRLGGFQPILLTSGGFFAKFCKKASLEGTDFASEKIRALVGTDFGARNPCPRGHKLRKFSPLVGARISPDFLCRPRCHGSAAPSAATLAMLRRPRIHLACLPRPGAAA